MTTTYKGLPCCTCQRDWLTVFERELADRNLAPLQIAQLIGNAPASAGRHSGGGNIDWWTTSIEVARLSRNFGGLAMIRDGSRDSFDNNKHTHTYLYGCPHMSDGAKRDMAEVLRGGDGLVGSTPDDPRLAGAWKGLTWGQGVKAMTELQLERKRKITLGTHNTLDGEGRETPFADVIIFTEALAREVRMNLAKTHRVWICKQQTDLVLAVHERLDSRMVRQEYRKVHGGIPLVTPKRGTWRTDLELLDVPVSGIWDHRINAAFPPYIRGERILRPRYWRKHDKITNEMIRDAKVWAQVVVAGGDPNTIKSVDAYEALRYEVGQGKDRLASNRKLIDVEELSKAGSDHHRLRCTLQL